MLGFASRNAPTSIVGSLVAGTKSSLVHLFVLEVAVKEIRHVLKHLSDTLRRPDVVALVGICLVLHRLVVQLEGFREVFGSN